MNLRITEHPTREDNVDCAVVLVVEDLAVPEDHRDFATRVGSRAHEHRHVLQQAPILRARPKAARS